MKASHSKRKTTRQPHRDRGRKGKGDIMAKATNNAASKAQAGKGAQANSKAKGGQQAKGKADSKPAASGNKAEAKADGRAATEAAALALVGDVKSHTGGRINLDSVRICPRKAGKVKAFLRPTYETPAGIELTAYAAGGFTGFIVCDLTTEAGRQALAALIGAKRKPTAAERKAAEAEASKADKPASKGKPTGTQGKGKAGTAPGKASKPTAGKGKGAGKAQASKPTEAQQASK